MAGDFLLEALVLAIELNDRVTIRAIRDSLRQEDFAAIPTCQFAVKLSNAIDLQDQIWLDFDAEYELFDALEGFKLTKLAASDNDAFLRAPENTYNFEEYGNNVAVKLQISLPTMFQNAVPPPPPMNRRSTSRKGSFTLNTVLNGLPFRKKKDSPEPLSATSPDVIPSMSVPKTFPPRDSSNQLKIVTSPDAVDTKPAYPKYRGASRKASIISTASSNGTNVKHHSLQPSVNSPTASGANRYHERQHEMWLVYMDWLESLKNNPESPCFSEYQISRSISRSRRPSSATFVDNHYLAPKTFSNSHSTHSSYVSDTTFAIPSSPTQSLGKKSSRVVSFGGNSVRSFNSAESPSSVNLPSDDVKTEANVEPQPRTKRSSSVPNANTPAPLFIHKSQQQDLTALLPLPPHHSLVIPLPPMQRNEALAIRPSNDFITVLLGYKSQKAAMDNKQRRSTSSASPPLYPQPAPPPSNPNQASSQNSDPRSSSRGWSGLLAGLLKVSTEGAAVALHKYAGGSRRNVELWDYGLNPDGRISITLVDVLFCFPKVRKPTLMDVVENPSLAGPSERFIKTVMALHATALMSLLEMRTYPHEEESVIWNLFVARYEARREVELEQRKGI
ncbi:hypothetical protein BCR33DRAFT_738410 [Rhizoclosmatium globosum]|uniref:Uncharacterized protein n=1 Tax=Rhizoclosmatium globosum TaxID=329046 RepID=A0A1Y2C9F3_9FUNG|nr:hypothetical protein BCR33DRAFT_738410 [Rhizoclosmatium globosum]|eukprot:ORY43663.1 hypothetical protein BCR33DRAFT_738410 [Rhizoclosmatium globosum]